MQIMSYLVNKNLTNCSYFVNCWTAWSHGKAINLFSTTDRDDKVEIRFFLFKACCFKIVAMHNEFHNKI